MGGELAAMGLPLPWVPLLRVEQVLGARCRLPGCAYCDSLRSAAQELGETLTKLTEGRLAACMTLSETWYREHQVLPFRTHPHMNHRCLPLARPASLQGSHMALLRLGGPIPVRSGKQPIPMGCGRAV